MIHRIVLTETAAAMLAAVADRRVREAIRDRIDQLARDPDKQGKALVGALAGYRSIRAVGQRYGVIYRVEGAIVTVLIVAVGIRKEGDRRDIYTLAQKLFRTGLLAAPARRKRK